MDDQNIYEQQRKQAYDRLLQQLAAKQAYVNNQAQRDASARQLELKHQQMAAPGSREINWAGKGGAAGGPWGALVGAIAGRVANASEAKGAKGKLNAMFGLGDLKNALKYSGSANTDADALAGAAGQERARASTARLARAQGTQAPVANTNAQPNEVDSKGWKFASTGNGGMTESGAAPVSLGGINSPSSGGGSYSGSDRGRAYAQNDDVDPATGLPRQRRW